MVAGRKTYTSNLTCPTCGARLYWREFFGHYYCEDCNKKVNVSELRPWHLIQEERRIRLSYVSMLQFEVWRGEKK